jgi:hypothetical protein
MGKKDTKKYCLDIFDLLKWKADMADLLVTVAILCEYSLPNIQIKAWWLFC